MEVKSIREVLTSNVISVSPDTSVSEALLNMTTEETSCILISNENKPVGIFTERDVVKSIQHDIDLNNIKISELMTSPVVTSTDDIDLHEAYDILLSNKIRHFVVVDTRG
ncbi:MAG: CBS domain-containing protein, partial [Candidatus Brocadiaceae bacterium]|nr:CBS domain-containing protein [Candidatus Brocadiaceae bacterium]